MAELSDISRDLDLLRPPKKIIRIGGHDIDISFIPCGIAFEVEELSKKILKLDSKALSDGDEKEQKKAFMLAVELCAVYCKRKYPELTVDWFLDNATVEQVMDFSSAIRDSFTADNKSIGAYGTKNL